MSIKNILDNAWKSAWFEDILWAYCFYFDEIVCQEKQVVKSALTGGKENMYWLTGN